MYIINLVFVSSFVLSEQRETTGLVKTTKALFSKETTNSVHECDTKIPSL